MQPLHLMTDFSRVFEDAQMHGELLAMSFAGDGLWVKRRSPAPPPFGGEILTGERGGLCRSIPTALNAKNPKTVERRKSRIYAVVELHLRRRR